MMMPDRTGRPNEEPLLAELTYADLPSFLKDTTQYFALGHLFLPTQNPHYRVGQEGPCEIVLPVMGDRLRCYAQVARRLPDGVVFTIQRWEPEHAEQLWRFVAIAWPMLRESGFEQFKGPAPTPAARLNIKSLVNHAEKDYIKKGIQESLGGEAPPRAAADYLRALEEISQISEITQEITLGPEAPPEPPPTPPIPDPFGSPPKPAMPRPEPRREAVARVDRPAPRDEAEAAEALWTGDPDPAREEEDTLSGIYRYEGPPIREAAVVTSGPSDDELDGIYRYRPDPPQAEASVHRFTPLHEEAAPDAEDEDDDDVFGFYRYSPGELDEQLGDGSPGSWATGGSAPDVDSPAFDSWAAGEGPWDPEDDDLEGIYRHSPASAEPGAEGDLDPADDDLQGDDDAWDDLGDFRPPSRPAHIAPLLTHARRVEEPPYRPAAPRREAAALADDADLWSRALDTRLEDDPEPWTPAPPATAWPRMVIHNREIDAEQALELTPDPFNLMDLGIEPPNTDWLAPPPPDRTPAAQARSAAAIVPPAPRPAIAPPPPAPRAPTPSPARPAARPRSPQAAPVRVVSTPSLRGQRWNLRQRGLALVLADCLRRGVNGWLGVVTGTVARRLRLEDGQVVQIEQRPRPDLRLLSTAAAGVHINPGLITELGDLLSQEDRPEDRLVDLGRLSDLQAGRLLCRRLSLQLSRAIDEGWRGEAILEADYAAPGSLFPTQPQPAVPMARLIWNGLRAKTDLADEPKLLGYLKDVLDDVVEWNSKEPFPIDEIEPRGMEQTILSVLRAQGPEGIAAAEQEGASRGQIAAAVWCLVHLGLLRHSEPGS